jgi:UDP-N-acetylmuramoyl-L-alanyl-D-glutamate--2,6-diaminopimelate ligase
MTDASNQGGRGVSLAAFLPGARFLDGADIRARRCTDDAKACRRGDVFVARTTPEGDGHDHVAHAVARGAAGVVAERLVATAGVPLCLVPDSGWAFARLQQALAGDPGRRLDVVGIAGSVGKTTTAWLTAAVMTEAGRRVGVLSDLGCLDADAHVAECCDYERPERLATWLARLAARRCPMAIVETTHRMLADQALAGVAFDTLAVTTLVGPRAGRPRARRLGRRAVAALKPDGCLVVGSRRLDWLLDHATAGGADRTCLVAGREGDVMVRCVERGLWGQTVLLSAAGESVPVTVDTPVPSFARDAAVAAAIGLRYGVPLHVAARGVEAAGSIAGRAERLDRGQDFTAVLDRAASGPGLAATLSALRRLARGRLAVVAEPAAVAQLGGAAARRRIAGRCDELLVPSSEMLCDDCGPAGLAAYARLDRLLGALGRDDCLLVLTAADRPGRPAGVPGLAAAVDGWLRLAHPYRGLASGRRVA